MKNSHDSEDMTADTFFKLFKVNKEFESDEHLKSWLIRTAINTCKDELKSAKRKTDNIDNYENLSVDFEINDLFQMLTQLPDTYREVLYLFYWEEYKAREIANILGKPTGTILTQLKKGRELLKKNLGGKSYEF
jgi:RNA polymerase sigma-70 factor (ECF subfamily)